MPGRPVSSRRGRRPCGCEARGEAGAIRSCAAAAIEPPVALGPAALASIGTDGRDGPTDAAGAFVDSSLFERLGASGRASLARALEDNDTYPLLEGLGALVRTGPTGTNVGDLQILLLE